MSSQAGGGSTQGYSHPGYFESSAAPITPGSSGDGNGNGHGGSGSPSAAAIAAVTATADGSPASNALVAAAAAKLLASQGGGPRSGGADFGTDYSGDFNIDPGGEWVGD